MIFTGDIASPSQEVTEQLDNIFIQHRAIFENKRLVCNFEGLIAERVVNKDTYPVLSNHPLVPDILSRGIAPVLCLANNHTLDLPMKFDATAAQLKKMNALFCGAGRSAAEASAHLTFYENGKTIVLINACWDFLLYSQSNPSHGVFVAEIDEIGLLNDVIRLKKLNKDISIIIFLHWGFDLEVLPFPMYRKFSHALIDAGANLIIGSHSHCVQGGEKYKGRYIIYGLGNFYMPHNIFAEGKIKYPDFTRTELVFEWNPYYNKAVCHWFEYRNAGTKHNLFHITSEEFEVSVLLKQYSPFQGMMENDYLAYFKENRRKRLLIPIFKDHKKIVQNRLFTFFLKNRARFAHLLARLNITKWQS